MKLFLGLCRHQCRVMAVVGLAGWALVVLLAWIGELAAGGFAVDLFSPYSFSILAAALLPEVLQVCLPLSLAQCLLSLAEGGELRALAASGVPPRVVVAALCVPLMPVLCALHPLVHDARPAALLRIGEPSSAPARMLWLGIVGQGIGLTRDERGLRLLLPVGDAALAVRARGVAVHAGAFAVGPGEAKVIAADGRVLPARFRELDLKFVTPLRGLADLGVGSLSTHFLETDSMRWRRARLDWGGRRSGESIAREVARRALVLPSVALGMLLCLGLLFVRRSLTVGWVHGVVTPLAVSLSVFLPRWLT